MTHLKYGVILLTLLAILSGCAKEEEFPSKKAYPVLEALEPAEFNETGITLSAKVHSAGTTPVKDYGFIWKGDRYEYKKSLAGTPLGKDFKYRVSGDLEKDMDFVYRAYIQTEDLLILSNKIPFKSKGNALPVIKDFYPKAGPDGTVVTLIADHLSANPARNTVYLSFRKAEIIYANADTIKFIVEQFNHTDMLLDIVLVVGARDVKADTQFLIKEPKLLSFSPLNGYSGNQVTLKVEDLGKNATTRVYFDQYEAEFVTVNKDEVSVIIPSVQNGTSVRQSTIKLTHNYKSYTFNQPFLIKNSWETKSAPIANAPGTDVFSYNGKGYMIEWSNKLMLEYNPVSDNWIHISTFPGEKRPNSVYITAENKLFKIGGIDNSLPNSPFWVSVNELWEYNFATKVWTQKTDLPFSFKQATSFLLNGKNYIITDQKQVWIFDAASLSFTKRNDFPVSFRDQIGESFVSGGKAYAVTTGQNWIYNETSDSWTVVSVNHFTSRNNAEFGSFTKTDDMYILDKRFLYKFDKIKNFWRLVSHLPGCLDARTNLAFTINDKTYVPFIFSSYCVAPVMYSYQD